MKRKLRKSLSWLLTVAMIFSLFCGMIPTASAVDDLEIEEYHFMDRDAFEDLCLRKLGYDRDDMRPGTYVTITSIQLIASDGSKNTAAAGDDEQFDMYNQHGYLTVGESAGEFIQPQDVAEIKVLINYWPTDKAISQSTYVSLSMDDFETTSFPEAKYVELRVKEDEKPSPDEEPDAPSVIQLQSLFADQIKVTCDNHHQTIAYGLNDVENGYSAPGEGVTKEEDVWTYTVTINYDPFVTKYSNDVVDGNDVETHALVNPSVTTEAVKLVWGSEGWAAAENQLPVVIETICTNPQVDYIQVNMSSAVKERYDSFGEGTSVRWIHIDLTESSSTLPHYYVMYGDTTRHPSGNTSENEIVGVTLGATLIEDRMYFSMSEDNGEYAQIEVSYGYDGDDYIMYLYCQLVEERDPGPEPGTLTLTYNYNNATDTTTSTTEVDSNTYATGATPSLKTAVSDTIDTVDDDVVFVGWTQDKNHYTKSAPATVKPDNLVTSVTFEAENITVYAAWAQDANNDGTPDYRQVFIEYVSNDIALGTVTPLRQTVTLGLGENGQPDTTNPIYLTGKATAVDGASFSYWMINDDITASYSADLQTAGYFLDNYTAGQTYVMKAYFMDEDIGKPEGPNTYSIYVKVENGTATFNGAVIDNYVFAGEGEDIAINFTGNENYVIDKATIDGVDYTEYLKYDESYTFKAVSQSHMITVIYAADEKGELDENGNDKGDGIPDYRQVFIQYESENPKLGTVNPQIQTTTLELDKNGQPVIKPIYLTGKATAVDGASFSYWMINDDITASYSADLQTAGYFLDNYTAGQTYVMKAYFMDEDIGKPEGPNTYSIYVKVENGTATFNGAVIDNYVFAGEGEDIAINFTGNENYVIDKATIDGVDYTEYLKYDESYTFKAVSQSHMITVIYAADEKGAWDDNGNEQGDGIPDKYQKKVTFQVVNGTWADGTRTDKIEYVTLTDESGKYSESGKGSLNAPTGMIADTGFQNGAWDTVLPTEVRGTEDATYTYTFSAIPVTYYNVTFNTNGGTTPSWSQSVVQGQAVNEPTDPVWNDDYIFMGWTTETISGETYGVGENLPGMVFQNGASFTPADNTTLYAVWGEDSNHDGEEDVYEVFIAPADITIYTGGTGYEGVSDGDGNEIENSNSGLPEPGFHIILPADLGLEDGNDLNGIVKFQYNGEDKITGTEVNRKWTLSCVGVYSETPLRYVYSLVSADGTPAVRVTYTDENDEAVEHDRIDMSANAASAKYDMSINAGGLEQNNIEAVITVGDREVTRKLVIGTGELTIRSTVDRTDNTNTIADNAGEVSDGSFNAVGNNASYVVNDSEVPVSTADDRVQLLVDQVSNSTAFNNAMGEAALDHPQVNGTAFETVYLDLVDTQNGNTVVTLNTGSMDIYWPMPSNADPYGDFQVVHYVDMNREVSASEGSLDTQDTELLNGTAERINGDWYVRFTTHSFSPFVLVYEEDTSRPVNPNPGGGSGGGDDHDPTGNLSIELDVNGGDDEFTFTVILTDKDGDDLENNFYYNGDYTGTIGSGDEITLEGGDKIVIRNLPEGTRYEVVIETADGYTYVIDGEEGVIHTGMNEAEFTATRTVPVADPSVTGVSRWLNTTDHIAYLTGYPGGAFGPDNNMTRAEVAQMFYALLNNKNVTITKTFPDVPADAWYATAVNTLASLGMVSGDENGNYRPNDPITRAEFCVIALAFAYEPENAVCYFGDVSRSDWFYTYVAQAASYGWIGGYTNGNFGPNDRITRAQVTTIVNNMLGRAADRDYVIDHQADLVQFTDLTRAHWGYFQIMEATNAHDYTKSNGTESWR